MRLNLLFVAGLIVISAAATAQAAQAQVPGWELQQYSSYFGKQTAWITAKKAAVKTDMGTILFDAGGKTYTMYNPKNQTIYEVPIDQWTKKMKWEIESGLGTASNKTGSANISGLATNHHPMYKTSTGKPSLMAELWAAPRSGIPPHMAKPLTQFFGFPPELGLPVKVIRHALPRDGQPGSKATVLTTSSLVRKNIPNSTFKRPTGYRPVSDEVSLMLDAGSSAATK